MRAGVLGWAQGAQTLPQVARQSTQTIAVINIPALEEGSPAPQQGAAPTTLTIGPLIAQRGEQAWLAKAIADLLIKNLSEVQSLIVLEREKMQTFSDEVGLADSALFNQEKALRVGRVARVEKVIYGNYVLKGDTITIAVSLMELQTQKVLQTQEITGPYEDFRSLIKQLVLKILAKQNVPLSESEENNIHFKVTDSMTATEHFYQGIDAYDQGKYPEAFGEFLKAARLDPQYLEAHLWTGRLFEALGFYEHAVLSYETLYANHPQRTEARDALLFAGKVLEFKLGEYERAVSVYRKVAGIKPVNPHSLQASFRLGNLLEILGDDEGAYWELKKIDDFRNQLVEQPLSALRLETRHSPFVNWKETIELYKESIVKMVALYQRLCARRPPPTAPEMGSLALRPTVSPMATETTPGKLPPPPRGVILLNPDNPRFKEQQFGHTPSLFPREQIYPDWHEELYVVLVPKGYAATGIEFGMTGQMKELNPGYDFTLRVLPFPLPRDFDRRWYGVIFGQTEEKTTLKKYVSFHGENPEIFTLQLLENHSQIFDWEINVKLTAKDKIKDASQKIEPIESPEFWEGRPLAKIPLQVQKKAGSTRTLQQIWYRSKKELDLAYDPKLGNGLVVVQGELDGEQTDLWFTHSR